MRVNPVTRTPTPRYAPGRRRRACHQTPTRIRGPTRESADPRADRGPAPAIAGPRANQWIHARSVGSTCAARNAGSSRLEQFRMQFDWVNFQQYLQTLQFQRYGRAVRHGVGGIACDIHGKLTGRESCAATHSTAGSTAGDLARWIPSPQTTCPSPTVTDQGATHRLTIKQAPTRGAASRPPRDHVQARNETTTSNTDFPTPTNQKVATNQHVLSFNPGLEATRRATLAARATSGREGPAPRSGAIST